MSFLTKSIALLALAASLMLAGCNDNYPPKSEQIGYRGVGMVQTTRPAKEEAKRVLNAAPEAEPAADNDGPRMSELKDTYKNIQVLGDLSEAQFTRTMISITNWVVPKEVRDAGNGCAYCHNVENMADDSVYTKGVARRMLQMTRHINADWQQHVAATGVTCYTCHRGIPVPQHVWYEDPAPQPLGMTGNWRGNDHPAKGIGLASLPKDPFTPLLSKPVADDSLVRVVSTEALAVKGPGKTIQETEQTYALMIHLSKALNVNCTFCHNADSFANWETSTPQRASAWYGIRMVRDINGNYITPLASVFPANRKGEMGDPAKVFCTTCHQNVNKPLYGVSMLKDYQAELGGKPGDPGNK